MTQNRQMNQLANASDRVLYGLANFIYYAFAIITWTISFVKK